MNIKYSKVRRVRITAPMSERQQVIDWLFKNGYRIRFIGPKSLGGHNADMTRLVVICEKEA